MKHRVSPLQDKRRKKEDGGEEKRASLKKPLALRGKMRALKKPLMDELTRALEAVAFIKRPTRRILGVQSTPFVPDMAGFHLKERDEPVTFTGTYGTTYESRFAGEESVLEKVAKELGRYDRKATYDFLVVQRFVSYQDAFCSNQLKPQEAVDYSKPMCLFMVEGSHAMRPETRTLLVGTRFRCDVRARYNMLHNNLYIKPPSSEMTYSILESRKNACSKVFYALSFYNLN